MIAIIPLAKVIYVAGPKLKEQGNILLLESEGEKETG